MDPMTAKFTRAADLLAGWRDDLLSGERPTTYPTGSGELGKLEIRPGTVTLLGGAPGAGKTALVNQLALDAMRLTPELKTVIANVEMPHVVLLERQLARLSGIPLDTIIDRDLTEEHADRLDYGLGQLAAVADRLAFVSPPFDLGNIAETADACGADLLILDYAQRIAPPGDHPDKRNQVNALMDYLRQFADCGLAVIVLSAIGRTKDKRGNSGYSPEGMGLGSFRESSELEFGCDSAYLILPEGAADASGVVPVLAKCCKNRNGRPEDLHLTFDGAIQRFGDAPGYGLATAWNPDSPLANGDFA